MAIRVYKGEKLEMTESMKFQEPKTSDTAPHMKNFLAAVKSRKQTDLHADIEEGHISAALVHLANASYRVGRTLHFDPATEKFVNDAEANKLITREYRKPFVVPERV
jgi:hypothetical protein